jgi:hypothetical protein
MSEEELKREEVGSVPTSSEGGRGRGRRGPRGGGGEKTCYNCGEVRLLSGSRCSLLQRFNIVAHIFRQSLVTLPEIVRILALKVTLGKSLTMLEPGIAVASIVAKWDISRPIVPSQQATKLVTTVEKRVTLPRTALNPISKPLNKHCSFDFLYVRKFYPECFSTCSLVIYQKTYVRTAFYCRQYLWLLTDLF